MKSIMTEPRLRMRKISKSFGGVHALRDVTLEAYPGEVHALCGENGAGKSTLMKILAGALVADEGTIELNGKTAAFAGPRDAEDAGVRIIYQELNLVPDLTVAANIFLGREKTRGLGWLDDRTMEAESRRLFERLGAPVSPRARSATCASAISRWWRSPRRSCSRRKSSSWMSRRRRSPTPKSRGSFVSLPTCARPEPRSCISPIR